MWVAFGQLWLSSAKVALISSNFGIHSSMHRFVSPTAGWFRPISSVHGWFRESRASVNFVQISGGFDSTWPGVEQVRACVGQTRPRCRAGFGQVCVGFGQIRTGVVQLLQACLFFKAFRKHFFRARGGVREQTGTKDRLVRFDRRHAGRYASCEIASDRTSSTRRCPIPAHLGQIRPPIPRHLTNVC